MTTRAARVGAALFVAVAALSTSGRSFAANAPTPRLSHAGPFLTDPAGRVVFLHGINAVWKRAPYVAPDSAAGFTAADADFLASNGINAVRLGVLFAGVMPNRGEVDQGYLAKIDRIVQLLATRHIWVLLDFHQDAFNEKFKGEGFPPWAVHDDGIPFVDAGSFFANYQTPAVQRNYDHFWNDDFGLWNSYTEAWTAVAKKWATQPYLMGYDLFNEPSAGSQTPTCASPAGCPAFDATMQKLYEHVLAGIRTVDPVNMVWFEEQFFFNAISAGNFTHVADPRVGLSWHDYACTPAFVSGGLIPGNPDCTINEPRVMDNAAHQVAVMGAGSLLSEFGAGDDLQDLARMTSIADQHLVGWMYWAYKLWDDPTGSRFEGLYTNDSQPSSLKTAKVDVLVHPYPQAVAGIPTSFSWDPAAKVMDLTFTPRPATGLTDVFVPARTYASGYTAIVTGGTVRSAPGGAHVLVDAAASASRVHVIVRPGETHSAIGAPPGSATGGASPGRTLPATGLRTAIPLAGLVAIIAALSLVGLRRRRQD